MKSIYLSKDDFGFAEIEDIGQVSQGDLTQHCSHKLPNCLVSKIWNLSIHAIPVVGSFHQFHICWLNVLNVSLLKSLTRQHRDTQQSFTYNQGKRSKLLVFSPVLEKISAPTKIDLLTSAPFNANNIITCISQTLFNVKHLNFQLLIYHFM